MAEIPSTHVGNVYLKQSQRLKKMWVENVPTARQNQMIYILPG